MLFVVVITLSRASTAYFLMQLTPIRQQRQFILALLGFIAVWGLVFFVVMAVSCGNPSPWELVGRRCSGYVSCLARYCGFLIVH
jgi:hypothetical protein